MTYLTRSAIGVVIGAVFGEMFPYFCTTATVWEVIEMVGLFGFF